MAIVSNCFAIAILFCVVALLLVAVIY
jgi:hypothetical protein